jgi:hypothetical protein
MLLPLEKYNIEGFENLDDLLVSFFTSRCNCIRQVMYLYHVLFAIMSIYDINCQKKSQQIKLGSMVMVP